MQLAKVSRLVKRS